MGWCCALAADLGWPVTSPQVAFPRGYKGIGMYCFKMPSCSHLTHLLHPDGERRVLPGSPLTTQIVPHLPSLVSFLYLLMQVLFVSVPLLSLTSFSPGLHLFLLLSRDREESHLSQRLWAAVWAGWGLTGRQQSPAAHSRQGVLGRGTGLPTENPFFSAGYREIISLSNTRRSQENYMLHIRNSLCESPGQASSRRDVPGYHLPSAGAAEGVSGPRGPRQSLKHPTFRKDAPQRRNPILCQALSSPKPTGSPAAHFKAQDVGWYATTQIKCHLSWQSLCPLHFYSSQGLSSGHGQASNEKT